MKAVAGFCLALASMAAWAVEPSKLAGYYEVRMIECLDRSMSSEDQLVLSKWIFATVLRHPDLQSLSSVQDAEREQLMRAAAAMLERLIEEDCKRELVAVTRYEGRASLMRAMQHLDNKVIKEIYSNPEVKGEMARIKSYIRQRHMTQRLKEEALQPER